MCLQSEDGLLEQHQGQEEEAVLSDKAGEEEVGAEQVRGISPLVPRHMQSTCAACLVPQAAVC
jgi:hypothetical protein